MTKLILVSILTLMVSACNQSQGISGIPTNSNFQNIPPRNDNGQTPLNEPILECNSKSSEDEKLSVQVKAFFEDSSELRPDLLRIRIPKAIANFATDKNLSLEFYRWLVTPDGSKTEIDSTPLKYAFESFPDLRLMSDFYDSNVKNLNYEALPKDVKLEDLVIAVHSTASPYQVIRVVLKNKSSNSTSVVSQVDLLMPTFYANPLVYRDTHSSQSLLQALHPFNSRINSGWKTSDYVNFGKSFCF